MLSSSWNLNRHIQNVHHHTADEARQQPQTKEVVNVHYFFLLIQSQMYLSHLNQVSTQQKASGKHNMSTKSESSKSQCLRSAQVSTEHDNNCIWFQYSNLRVNYMLNLLFLHFRMLSRRWICRNKPGLTSTTSTPLAKLL